MATALCVMCVNDGRIFQSGGSAARWYGFSREQIGRCVKGIRKSVKGLFFVRVDDPADISACKELRRRALYNLMRVTNTGELTLDYIHDDEPFPDWYHLTDDEILADLAEMEG